MHNHDADRTTQVHDGVAVHPRESQETTDGGRDQLHGLPGVPLREVRHIPANVPRRQTAQIHPATAIGRRSEEHPDVSPVRISSRRRRAAIHLQIPVELPQQRCNTLATLLELNADLGLLSTENPRIVTDVRRIQRPCRAGSGREQSKGGHTTKHRDNHDIGITGSSQSRV